MSIETRWIIGTGVAIMVAIIGAAAVVITVLTAQLDEIRREVGANAGPRLQPLSDFSPPAGDVAGYCARADSSFRTHPSLREIAVEDAPSLGSRWRGRFREARRDDGRYEVLARKYL
ncbi:MAG: hypothetical protein OXQ28_06240 [Acidobacteriota bacterium]|nr:hypothetical protein [Acidobacteriota bacterium]